VDLFGIEALLAPKRGLGENGCAGRPLGQCGPFSPVDSEVVRLTRALHILASSARQDCQGGFWLDFFTVHVYTCVCDNQDTHKYVK